MSAQAVAGSPPHFLSTLKPQKVVENVDVLLSCSVSGDPEPEVTWYKGDKQLTKVLEPTRYEMLKDGKVHTLKLHRCTENDTAVYQVSARNSKGIAICSSVLQVGFVMEAQAKQQMMQKLKERKRAKKAPSSPEVNSPSGHRKTYKDDSLTATVNIHLDLAENRARPPAEGEKDQSIEGSPAGVSASAGRMSSSDEVESSAVPHHPNTGKRHQLNEVPETGAGSQMIFTEGDRSYNPRMGDLSGAAFPRRTKKKFRMSDGDVIGEGLPRNAVQSCSPTHPCGAKGLITPDDEYYLDLLVCSDILTEENDAAWRQKLDSRHYVSLSTGSEDPETDEVKWTSQPAPLGRPDPKLTAMGVIGAPCCQLEAAAVGIGARASSTRISTLMGRSPTSEESRAPGKGGDETCSIPSELSTLSTEDQTAAWKGVSSKQPPASVNPKMIAGEKRVGLVSDGRIEFVRAEEGKTTEVEKGGVLKEECWQKTSLKEDNPEDTRSSLGGGTLPGGELLGTGEMYNLPLGTSTTQSHAVSEICEFTTNSRLPHASERPVKPPAVLENASLRMEGECIHEREEAETGSEEKSCCSSGRAEIQPLPLKDEATSFTKITTSSNSVYQEEKTNLLPLDTNVTLPSTKYCQDQEDAHGRLKTDFEISNNPSILDSTISQSSEFKDKYQIQVLQEKRSNIISRDNELTCTSKEDQGSIFEAKIEHTRHFTDTLKRDCCIESKKSDFDENTSNCNKELEPSEKSPVLYIHNEYTDHLSSITSEGCESDDSSKKELKKVGKYGSIDPCLDIPPHSSIPAQTKDISASLTIGSNIFQDNEKKLDKESNSSSYCDMNNRARHDEIPLQVSECFENESKHMDGSREEFEHSEPSFGSIVNVCKLGVHKDLTGQSEESVLENEYSQKDSPKSHWLPPNKAEILCPSENEVHKVDISTHWPIHYSQTENEAVRNCSDSHNSNEIPSFPETNKPTAFQLDDKLPFEHPVLFECNLDVLPNQLLPKHLTFNCEINGSDYPSKDSVLDEPLVVNLQDISTSTLVDCEKMQYNESSLLESPCWNKTKSIDNEGISKLILFEREDVYKAETDMDKNQQENISRSDHELVCKQFYNSPVSFPPSENEHFNFQLRNGQSSETVLPLKHYVTGHENSSEPEIVKSDNLKSSMLQLVDVDQNTSPLTETNQQRMINIEGKKVANVTDHSECPTQKEQKSPIAHPVVIEQSIGFQQVPRQVENSVEHVVVVGIDDDHGKMQITKNVQTVPIDNLEPSLIHEPMNDLTKIIQPVVKDESHFQSLSIQAPDETKATDNETVMNPSGSFMCAVEHSSHFDESLFQNITSQAEMSTANHNICFTECDNKLGHDHVDDKTTSTKNLPSAVFSVGPIMNVLSKAEQVKGENIESPTADLNEDIQKAEYVHETNLTEISNFIANTDKIVESQAEERQHSNCMEKENDNKTIQQSDSFHLTSTDSRGSDIITQQVAGQIMNVDSTTPEDCIEHNKSSLNKSNSQVIVLDHPLEYIKVNIDDEYKGEVCQMSVVPSKSNQKSSNVSKNEKVTPNKNDNHTKFIGTQTMITSLDEGQKRTIEPELPISLQRKSLSKKRFPLVESLSTVDRIKQPTATESVKELLMSGAQKKSNSSSNVASEFEDLFPSQNEQKKEVIKRVLSADNVKSTLDKNKQMQSSAGRDNLNKTNTVIKRTFQKTMEEAAIKKEQKEVEKVKYPQKEEHKAPKLIQKIHAEVLPDIPGNVKLWCLFGDIHADSTIIWTKDGGILTKSERSAGDDTPVSLAIVQTAKKDRGLYQCTLKNVYGSVSCEFDFTTEVLNELLGYQAVEGVSVRIFLSILNPENLGSWEDTSLRTPQVSTAESPEFNQSKLCDLSTERQGEKIELLQPIIEKELTSECNFQPKIYGSIATEESYFGEGLHRKAFRTKVIYGLVPLFDPGHSCVLKIHNAISYGTKTKSELIQRSYILAVQECHVQNAARQYGNMFSAVGTLLEGFGEAPEIIPIYLIHRPANNIPYATVEEELVGDFVKYSVKDGRELNVGRKESEVGQKCCTFQHWVYEWTEGNLLVTDLQGVGMKLTDVGIATCRKGYKGFKGNCSVSFIDQFKALHQCNIYCKIMGLKSLNLSQHKPRRNPPMKAPLSKPAPGSMKRMLVSPRSTITNFTSQAKSISGDGSIQKYL